MKITTTRMLQTSYIIQEGINKQEFVDGISLRYRWSISHFSNLCVYSAKYYIDDVLTCKKGGYVSMSHDVLRDAEAKQVG